MKLWPVIPKWLAFMNTHLATADFVFECLVPGVHVSVSKLPVLAVTKCVDISVLHQHHCEATGDCYILTLLTSKLQIYADDARAEVAVREINLPEW